ncbi:MAG: hypothetical protein HY077_15385 [Elusimicrobia bacterium]|nr:hypothetical protein [Elusimicrobiota bacterium]
MRYFIYSDGNVSGPFDPRELEESGGLPADALVCAESLSGRRDSDWLPACEVAGLSALRPSSATAVLDEPLLPGETGAFERLELETFGGPAAGDGENWLLDLFDDAQFRQRWGELLPKPSEDAEEVSQARISELTGQLEALKSRLSELEKLKVVSAAAPPPVFEPPPPQPQSLLSAPPPAPIPAPAAEPLAPPPLPAPPAPLEKELPPIKLGAAKPALTPLPLGPQTDFQKQGAKFEFRGKPAAQPPGASRPIHFAPSQSFRVVEKEPHPAELPPAAAPTAAAAAYEWGSPPPAAGLPGLPAAGTAPGLPDVPLEPSQPSIPAAGGLPLAPAPLTSVPPPVTLTPPPLEAPAQAPPMTTPPAQYRPPPTTASPASTAPPMTMMFGSPFAAPPASAQAFPQAMPPLEPPPVPQMNAFGVSVPGALTPSRANEGVITPADEGGQDVVARLAKPAPAPGTDKKPKPRRSLAIPVMSVLVILLSVLAVVFLYKRPKDLKTMASMETGQKPMGRAVEEESKTPLSAKPSAPAPEPVPAKPAPSAQGRDAIPDAGEAAITLVKNTPLAGDRGSVGQWLSYSYNAEGGNKEDWSAGAVEATAYAVEYKVQPGPSSKLKDAISYLFEADISRKTVQGKNQAAKLLLAGGESAPKPKKAAKTGYRRRARKAAAPAAPRDVPLAPLPADSELLPPSEDDSSFKTDTVQPGL